MEFTKIHAIIDEYLSNGGLSAMRNIYSKTQTHIFITKQQDFSITVPKPQI